MAGMQARAVLLAAEGGRRPATTEPHGGTTRPCTAICRRGRRRCLPRTRSRRGMNFQRFLSAAVRRNCCRRWCSQAGRQATDAASTRHSCRLQQGLGGDGDGGVDLRFGLCSGGARESSHTFIIDADPSPRGVQQSGSQHTEQSTLRGGVSVSGVGPSAAGRQHGSSAPSADRLTSTCPAHNGVAVGFLHIGGARPSMSKSTTPTQPDLRDDGTCRPAVRPAPTVENITRGVSNMRAHSDGGDDDGGGGDDADERFREDVEAGDDDDDIPIRPLGKTGGRGRGRSRGAVHGRSVGRGGRGGVSDDGGKSVTYWSSEEQMQLVRCKREREMHLAGLGHNYGRMRTKEWKWDDIAKRMANAGRPKDAKDCMKKWDNIFQNHKKIHRFQNASGRPDFFRLSNEERKEHNFKFRMERALYNEIHTGMVGNHTVFPPNIADTGSPDGVQLPRRGAGAGESRSPRNMSTRGNTRGTKRDVVPDDSQGQGRGQRQAPKAKRVRSEDASARVPRRGAQGWAAAAEGDYDEEFTTEEEQAEVTTSEVRESGRQRSSHHTASKRMLTPPPEAQQLCGGETRTEKAPVVDLGGDHDEPLERRRIRIRTTATPPPAVTARAAANERPVSGRLSATPSQRRQRNEGGDGGSVQCGSGGEVMADARAVGAEEAGAAGAGGSGTVAAVATAKEEATVVATTREEARGEKKGDREAGEPGTARSGATLSVRRFARTIDLSMDLPLWLAGANIEDRPDDDDMAAHQESTVICVVHAFRAVVQMGALIDGEFISHDRLCRVVDCFRLLLAACMWIMRMAGDDPRSHYKAFYFTNLVGKPTLVAAMHRSFDHRRSVVRAAKVVTERFGKANATLGQYPDYIPQWALCDIGFRHDASITGPEDAKKLDWLGSASPDDDNNNEGKNDV
ncbi:hypothetical protein CBR_g27799 [Chara braunii]|uniref:Myb-like domain-containing protein n=1 Tax=Chara braunii TaxID=69332 RepID=A0A388L8G6_CHABU|nr:hypothetical protein CBR_g27799 [Chara braunii]|eukprot:GBG78574.1 hypothetical protein CBR_g27799 [Chara braunii]